MAYKRKALSLFISSNPYMVVVNIARTGIDAMKMVEKYSPDILIIDIISKNLQFWYGFRDLNDNIHLPTIYILDTKDNLNSIAKKLIDLKFKEFHFVRKSEGKYEEQYQGIHDLLTDKILRIFKIKIQKLEKRKKEIRRSLNIIEENSFLNRNQISKIVRDQKVLKNETEQTEEIRYDIQESTSISSIPLETNIIVMGASVGGPKTLRTILKDIPSSFPSPILLVQHLDHFFMRQFAVSLKQDCNLNVKIPRNGELIDTKTIYVSPGGYHMEIIVLKKKPAIRIFEGEPVNYCRPSVDVLFLSAAKVYKNNTLGILLTGMGSDGVEGLLAIKLNGGKTIAESEETSILYGMPKIAKQRQAADHIVPNYKIKDYMIKFAKRLQE